MREDLTWDDVKKNWNVENNKQKNALKRGKSLLFDASDSPKKTNDNDSPANDETADPVDSRALCKYGEKCYNKNAEHLQKYAHPASETKKRAETEALENENRKKSKVAIQIDKPICPFGMQCARKNPTHFEQFNHDPKQTAPLHAHNQNNNNFAGNGELRYAYNIDRNGDAIDETKAEDDSEGTMVMDEFQLDSDMLMRGVLFASSPKHEREKKDLEESDETLCLVSQREYEEVVHRIEKLEEIVRDMEGK